MTLAPASPGDWPRVSTWLAKRRVTRWLGPPLAGLGQLQFQLLLARGPLFTIEDGAEKVGLVGIGAIDPGSASGEVWYLIGEEGREGRGIATEAVRLAIDRAFGELGLHSVRAWVASENAGSRRVLEKLGFKPAGVWRESFKDGDRFVDRCYFDLLAGEWKRATAASNAAGSAGGK